jgi:dihydroorotate dehydrogenase electron transfer subunit
MPHRGFRVGTVRGGPQHAGTGRAAYSSEESLCPVVSHDWVNAEYKHLIVDASPKALAVKPGQFFNLLCPSPDEGELWLRRPQSVYRIDEAKRRIEFLYKCVGRGTHGPGAAQARR